jgi:glycosyltransferase involved in cell wall biosynthesis
MAARFEAARLARWERALSQSAAAQVVTSLQDARALQGEVTVLPVGIDTEPFVEPDGHVRDIDVVLSGNMRYPPNRLAAQQLAGEILPRVRERRAVRAVIVGRAADTLGVEGVEIASDVASVDAYLRRSRVAALPLVDGTGTPYKALEAAAAGAALVTVPWVAEGFGIAAERAERPEQFAAAIVAVLDDEGRRRALVAAARPALEAHLTPVLAARLEAILQAAAR